jgi:hypothetical protein
MTLHEYPHLEQGSEDWLAARRGLVTASTVGNLITTRKLSAIDYDCPNCGAPKDEPCVGKRPPRAAIATKHAERAEVARTSNSGTVFEVASNDKSQALTLALVAERINGWSEESYVNDDMMRGILDEPIARNLYSKHFAPVTETGFMVEDRWGFRLGFSPDGLVGDDGLIEIKSRRPKTQVATVLAGHPPVENVPQLQAGLLVTGRKWLDYVSFAGGMNLFVTRVYPDQRWFEAIIKAVRTFEANAAEMQRLYQEGIEGMPITERRVEQEMVI